MDTEGLEVRTIKAIEESLLRYIKKIYLESSPEENLHPAMFDRHRYGSVCRLTNKALTSASPQRK